MLIFCQINVYISKIKRVLVLKIIFSETTWLCVLTHQISSFLFCMTIFCYTKLSCMTLTFQLAVSNTLFMNKKTLGCLLVLSC